MKPLSVLMTSVGNDGFPGVAEALKNNGEREICTIGVDIRPDATGLYLANKACLVLPRSDPKHIEQLLRILDKEKTNILFPLSTEDQTFYSQNIAKFHEHGIRVLVSDYKALEVANNKYLLYEFAKENNFPHPHFKKVTDWDSLMSGVKSLGYPKAPFVLKMDKGTGAQGLKVVHHMLDKQSRLMDRNNLHISFEELHFLMKDLTPWPDLHISEYLPGAEYSIDILCYRGKIHSAVVRKRLSAIYGLATRAEVVDEPDVESVAVDIVKSLGLSYVVNVQARRSADGKPKLMEINPRIPGTLSLTVAAGVNMPYLAVKLAIGEDITVPKPKLGTMILRYWSGAYPHASRLIRL